MGIPEIGIVVTPRYLADYSDVVNDEYVFAYHIEIENLSSEVVTLKRRFWLITDALDREETVEGAGVVGETPTLLPDEGFEYTSSARLKTPWGSMQGHYEFETSSGGYFKVAIPKFELHAEFNLQ